MLELILDKTSVLKKVFEIMKDLADHANLFCTATEFSLQAMEYSSIAIVDLHLRSEGFPHYRCDRNITIGMHLGNMNKMLNCAGPHDIMTLKAEDESDTATFLFQNPNEAGNFNFKMNLMQIDSQHYLPEEVEYHAIVRMPSTEFARICKCLSNFGDTVEISVTNEAVKFSSKGDDIGTAERVCLQNSNVNKTTVIKMKEPVTMRFALRYMNSFTKATPLSNTVTISLLPKEHVRLEYDIEDIGYVRFYLAAKSEEDNANPHV